MLSLNPYIAGNPVGGTPNFVGRADVLREVLRVMRQPHQNIIVLYGQRRIGKTSVLQQLAAHLPTEGNYYPVYFDLQDKASWSLGRVLTDLARVLSYELVRQGPSSMKQTGPLLSDVDPVKAFQETWLPATLNRLPEGHSIVLLFDEFDVLADPKGGQAGADLFPYLRGLMATDPTRLQFAFVIGRKVEDLESIALSLFKGAPALRVSLLNKVDTFELVRMSERNETLRWSDESLEKVWDLTHGHPFLTQQLCSRLWENLYDSDPTGIPTVIPEDVENAISDTLEASRNTLEWLWDGLPPAERVVISALAGAGNRAITRPQLEQLLRESGVRVVIRELQNAPQLLQDWDLIEPAEEGFRFRVELFRRWILDHKPLTRVQEELDRIEPLAENLYQAAYGFFRTNQLEDAMPLLRQAIGLNPNHARSRQLLAEIFLLRGEVDQAVQILQMLYDTQPAIARPRLVQALLLKAEEEVDEEKKQAIYQQIVIIDPSHPLASQRVAEYQRVARQKELAHLVDDLVKTEKEKRYRDALDVARKLAEKYPDERDWQPDLERLERKTKLADDYQRAIGALNSGDKETALRGLADVIALEPDYEEATRYLHLAKTGQDSAQLASQLIGEQKAHNKVLAELRDEILAHTEAEKQRDELQIRLENSEKYAAMRLRSSYRYFVWSIISTLLALIFFVAWMWRGFTIDTGLVAATQTSAVYLTNSILTMTPEFATDEMTEEAQATETPTEDGKNTETPSETLQVSDHTAEPTPTPNLTPTLETTVSPMPNPYAGPIPERALARIGKGQISQIALSPNGTLLAVAASTGLYIYRADTFDEVWSAPTNSWVLSVAFSDDKVAAGLTDGRIIQWSTENGGELGLLSGYESSVTSLAFSPGGNQLASGFTDGQIILWDLTSGKQSGNPLTQHTGKVSSLAYYPEGGYLVSGSEDGTVIYWELTENTDHEVIMTHKAAVTTVAFSPDAQFLASGAKDNEIHIWNVADKIELAPLSGHGEDVTSLAFSSNSQNLASGSTDGGVILWNVGNWGILGEFPGSSGITSLAFASDNNLYTAREDNNIVVSDLSGTPLRTLTGFTSKVNALAYAPNGNLLAAATGSTIILWDTSNGTIVKSLVGHTGEVTSLAFSHNGNWLASGSTDTTVILWDMNLMEYKRTFTGHTDKVWSVAFSPDDVVIASGSEDTNIILSQVDGADSVVLTGHFSSVDSVAFSKNGDFASGSAGGNVFLWNLANKIPLNDDRNSEHHAGAVFSIAFSPDGQQMASGSNDNKILLWDVASGKVINTLGELNSVISSVVFSLDGDWLVSGSLDGAVTFWPIGDLATQVSPVTELVHTAEVNTVAFSPDGSILASASSDGTILLWDISSILP